MNIKKLSVDLPLSPELLQLFFPLQFNDEKGIKKKVAISELNVAFGKDWHIFHFPESCTRKRVMGLVTLHYREKKFIQSGQALR